MMCSLRDWRPTLFSFLFSFIDVLARGASYVSVNTGAKRLFVEIGFERWTR